MKYLKSIFIIIQFASLAHCTCVFDSDFGFILNCNFKKSGLFRVRNLGGVKAHFGLGFSVGDELGLPESFGNLEVERRRALNYRTSIPNNIGVLPASELPINSKQDGIKIIQKKEIGTSRQFNKSKNLRPRPLMTEAASLPLGVPAFRPIPYKNKNIKSSVQVQNNGQFRKYLEPLNTTMQLARINNVQRNRNEIPPFQSLPQSISRDSTGNIIYVDTNHYFPDVDQVINMPKVDLMGHSVEDLAQAANVSVEVIQQAINMRQHQLLMEQNAAQTIFKEKQAPEPHTTSIPQFSQPAVTAPTYQNSNTLKSTQKVMNAPKEYYPVGYEKNFDDNFTTKVDLPTTSFNCGNQKHFPGLYADMNLGCMVFHVCALTDDGLIMKSFLCPESTLFDQTILKCNWWFYVDCKNSKSVYDSNIPISKSYQLMKSLKYFSNYNKQNEEELNLEALKNTVVEEKSKLT